MGRVKAYFTRWRRGYLLLPLAFLLLIYLSSGEAELPEVEISLPQVRTLEERIPARGKKKQDKEIRKSTEDYGEDEDKGSRDRASEERGPRLLKTTQHLEHAARSSRRAAFSCRSAAATCCLKVGGREWYHAAGVRSWHGFWI